MGQIPKVLKLGILQTDSVPVALKASFGDYPDMFQAMLSGAATDTVTTGVFNVVLGEFPDNIADYDGYLITGSRRSVYEHESWIEQLQEFVVALDKRKISLVGVCFGHQIIAQALGGDCRRAPVGWGVGVKEARILVNKSYMLPSLSSISILVFHQDQVMRLPDRAELIGSNDFCENSMFQIDSHILAIQGHPEFSKGYIEALLRSRREIIGEQVFVSGMASLERPTDKTAISQWIIRFLAGR
ncbi:MAG: hypothetical protein KUG79_09310 [Pseudomonadales bacterium]|nr:hypothetical protein [Pseudomonadales bacterium]